MIIRALIAVCAVALTFASAADDEFDAGVAAVRLLEGDEKLARLEVLVEYADAQREIDAQSVREAVGVAGKTRVPELVQSANGLMSRASAIRIKVGRLARLLKGDAPDADQILTDLVDLQQQSASTAAAASELVTRANSVSPSQIADAERAAREAEMKKQKEAADAAARAAQQQAAQQKAANEAALASTNPEYRNVSSENFWTENYSSDVELVAEIETNQGTMTVEFWPDVAPGHVKNFIDLAKKEFYDGVIFHRVIKDFMIQGGCPDGNGMGGPGYKIAAEFNDRLHERGVLSMARTADPNSAGSQFFVCHARAPHLDRQYTAFGRLLKGYEVLDAIATTQVGAQDRPVEPQTMLKVTVRARTDADVAEVR